MNHDDERNLDGENADRAEIRAEYAEEVPDDQDDILVRATHLERAMLDAIGSNHLRSITVDTLRARVDNPAQFPVALMGVIENGWVSATPDGLTITDAGRIEADHDGYRLRLAAVMCRTLGNVLHTRPSAVDTREALPAGVNGVAPSDDRRGLAALVARILRTVGEALEISGEITPEELRLTRDRWKGETPDVHLAGLRFLEDIAGALRGTEEGLL